MAIIPTKQLSNEVADTEKNEVYIIISNGTQEIKLTEDRLRIEFCFGKKNTVEMFIGVLHDAVNDYLAEKMESHTVVTSSHTD
jgi:hypothetical protein